MIDFGIKVSQPGHDVKTASKENLVFSSKYDTLKLFKSGSDTVTVPHDADLFTAGKLTVEVTHGLGYKPAFFVFVNNPVWANAARLAPYTWRSIGSPAINQPNYAVDTTKLYITFYNPDPDDDFDYEYRYHIYYNELA